MNILLRFGRLGMVISLTILLVTCVSTTFRVEPDTDQTGLAVGRIVFKANDFLGRPFSMTGTYTELTGVELTFRNTSGVETTVKSRRGYFYLNSGLGIESVRLTRLYYKRSTDSGRRTFETWVEGGSEYIRLKPGTVMNLGTIEWTAYRSSVSWRVKNVGHNELEAWFRETFRDSGWLSANWETAQLFASSPDLRWEWFYYY